MELVSAAMALAQFAPAAVRWLTNSPKAEEVATKVVDVAKAVTGQTSPEGAIDALRADPQLVLQFRLQMMGNEKEWDALYLQDVQHAREVHAHHWMPTALTFVLAIMVAGLLAGLFRSSTPPENAEVVYLIAGQLIGAFSTAVAFWLGTSRSSQVKDMWIWKR